MTPKEEQEWKDLAEILIGTCQTPDAALELMESPSIDLQDAETHLMEVGEVECCSVCNRWFSCEDIADSDEVVCEECME